MKFLLKGIPTFLLAICIGIVQPVMGQEEDVSKTLEELLYKFATDYESLPVTKNKQSVLKYFNREAKSNIFVFNISGRSRVENGNIPQFESFMENIIRSSGIKLTYNITEIVDITVKGKYASTVYKVNYEIKETDGIWVKGTETVTMAFEKKDADWKIVHYTFIQMEDEKLKGTCVCQLFSGDSNEGEIVTKTTVPNGKSYSTRFDNFEFRTIEGDWIIKVQNKLFKRVKAGPLYLLNEEGETQIGVPGSQKETVLMIIGDALYKDSCARIKSTK